MINVVGGGPGEAKFAQNAGLEKSRRFVCVDPQPLYCVNGLPHVTVIHRGGMVVRNGRAPDLETLLDAMAAEPADT
ncbi:MAG: hypothetical protein ACPIOQ_39660 [Promethearchaeia archaeon]|jgi:hypothetical protein